MTLTVLCAVAEMARDLIAERTRAGLEAARARSRRGGRRLSLTDKQAKQARRMRHDQDATLDEIAAVFGVSRSTIIRTLAPAKTST